MRRVLVLLTLVCSIIPAVGALLHYTGAVRAQSPAEGAADAPIYVMPRSGPFAPERIPVTQNEVIAAWARSGHSNAASPAFSLWNNAGVIPPVCAVCHSGSGFRSYHGLDGSPRGLPQRPVAVGGVVDCETCHNANLASVTEVSLPSGISHPVTTAEAPCLTCHQGRAAGATITAATEGKSEDAPDSALRFVNPHYGTAAATWLGGYGAAGYHYPGKDYSGRFLHARPVSTCVACHDPHSLRVAETTCLTCHSSGKADEIRFSRVSHDGSGDLRKGIRHDIAANTSRLKAMLHDYAAKVAGVPLVYDANSNPYFYADANGDGVADRADGRPVPYAAWTPRMLRAAYNWKLVTSDAGIHVHNPHYALELLYDSIEDLAGPLGVDLAALRLNR